MASSSSSSTGEKFLTLRSKDDKYFTVKESVAVQSVTIKNLVDDGCVGTIPLSNVDSGTLAVVLEYLNKHGDSDVSEEDKKKYDLDEIAKKPLKELIEIILAANYLDIKSLIEVVTQAIADNIKDKPVPDVRKIFGAEDDLTPEEKEKIRNDSPWAFRAEDLN